MSYYSLPIGKLHKQTRIRKLNNLPSNFETSLYKNYFDHIDSSFDSHFRKKLFLKLPAKMLKITCFQPVNLASICRRILICISLSTDLSSIRSQKM